MPKYSVTKPVFHTAWVDVPNEAAVFAAVLLLPYTAWQADDPQPSLDPYAYDINAVPREDPRVLGTCIICHEVVLMCPSGPCCPKGHLGAQYTEKT